ncbi:hypothetical protein WJ89_09065 [Burkholderia ubonensis]|nr:hypothetical protein WJ89_09065 [Burkholderia ubonensis]KVQ73772.1 hypothetical protein WK06_21665 [Burkholderia ubonensis]KVR05819.1 hypothetical protein WK12_27430 [Burkholderia ubonensis]KWD43878.1 hypothetical protein WL64_07065 [Burkholderia ubonensis]KWD46376.1 hypothetical protein WL63_29555 [Burkholderia ubonensis]
MHLIAIERYVQRATLTIGQWMEAKRESDALTWGLVRDGPCMYQLIDAWWIVVGWIGIPIGSDEVLLPSMDAM